MRITELTEDRTDFPMISAHQNYYDDESGLFLNHPSQWSKSPYLGAVSSSNGYKAQIHIPQEVWKQVIQDNPKWHGHLPDTFFSPEGKNRSTLQIQGFKDPRQAAWLVQTVLYGNDDPNELIEDYLIAKYIDKENGLSAWKHIVTSLPNFDGAPLTVADAQDWERKAAERKRAETVAINTDRYSQQMPDRIVNTFIQTLNNKPAKRKVFGNAKISLNKIKDVIQAAIKTHGVDYFVTAPGSLKLKDPLSFDLSSFVA